MCLALTCLRVVEAVGFLWRRTVVGLRTSGLESTASLVQSSAPLLPNPVSSLVLRSPICTMELARLSRLGVSPWQAA